MLTRGLFAVANLLSAGHVFDAPLKEFPWKLCNGAWAQKKTSSDGAISGREKSMTTS